MVELYIEGYPVELTDDVLIPLNLSIQNIKDLKTRKSSYSKTVRVPGTKSNNQLFGNTYDLNIETQSGLGTNINTNFNRKKKAEFVLKYNGSNVLTGVVQMNDVVVKNGEVTYSLVLYGELVNLMNVVADKELSDLDGSSLSHTFTLETISGSWDGNTDYVYPLIDYGVDNARMEGVTTDNLRPAIYAKWYWDKIMDEAGFTYQSDFINGDLFSKLIIPFNAEFIEPLDEIPSTKVSNTYIEINNINTKIYPYNTVIDDPDGYYTGTTQTYNTPISSSYDFIMQGQVGLYLNPFGYQGETIYDGNIVGNLSGSINVNLEVNGTVVATDQLIIPQETYVDRVESGGGLASETFYFSIPWTFSGIELNPNDTVRISAEFPGIGFYNFSRDEPYTDTYAFNLFFQNDATVLTVNGANILGSTLEYQQFVPVDVKQKDFVTVILRLFNLYTETDPNFANNLIVKQRDDFYAEERYKDWTNKISLDNDIRNELINDAQVRTLQFKYKKDDNDLYSNNYIRRWGREYGERRVNTGYEFSKEIKDVLELPFGTVIPIQYSPNSLPGDARIEVPENNPSNVRVLGYTDLLDVDPSETQPDLPQFRRALIGREIRIGSGSYEITDRISPWEFKVNTPVGANNAQTVNNIAYRVFNRTFQYTDFPDKVVPIITAEDDSEESGGTKPYDSELRICLFNGVIDCEPYTLQQTPIRLEGDVKYRYNNGLTKALTVSRYPFVSHVYGSSPTNFTYDLLFQQPSSINWSLETSGSV